MKMRFLFLALAPAMLASAAFSALQAAPGDGRQFGWRDDDDVDFDSLQSWSGAFDVRGELREGRDAVSASRLKLNLASNNTFTASVDVWRGRNGNFRGRWSRSNREIQLRIEEANGEKANGNGKITFSGRGRNLAIERIEIEARTNEQRGRDNKDRNKDRDRDRERDNEKISADLRAVGSEAIVGNDLRPRRANQGQNDWQNNWRERWRDRIGTGSLDQLFSTKSGQGTLRVENQRTESDLRNARVELSRDGRALIQLQGSREWNFEGRWRQDGRERIDLQLDSASSGSDFGLRRLPEPDGIGRGTIWLNGTSFSRLYLTGSLGRDEFRAIFEVSDSGSGWGNGGFGNQPDFGRPGFGRPDGNRPGANWPGANRPGGWFGNGWNDERPSNALHSGVYRSFTASGSIRLEQEPTDYAQRARIELRRDRTAFVEIVGRERFYVLRGTWTPDESGDYKLDLRPEWGYDRITGEVGTRGNSNDVDELELSGRFDNRAFSAYLSLS